MTRSATLLKGLLADGSLPSARIARALDCAECDLPQLALAEPAMTLEMQLRLAVLVIAEVPALARQGHSLKGQVEASMSFSERSTTPVDRPGWRKERR